MSIVGTERTSAYRSGQVERPTGRWISEMVEAALRHCGSKMGIADREQVAAALRVENREAHDYFRHALAGQVAEYLSELDDSVVGVYTYSYGDAEDEGEDRSCSVTASINLILHVRRKTAALSSVLASLDQGLLDLYKETVAPHAERMSSLLDVQMADDGEVEAGVGFGAVLKSIHNRPVRLWPS